MAKKREGKSKEIKKLKDELKDLKNNPGIGAPFFVSALIDAYRADEENDPEVINALKQASQRKTLPNAYIKDNQLKIEMLQSDMDTLASLGRQAYENSRSSVGQAVQDAIRYMHAKLNESNVDWSKEESVKRLATQAESLYQKSPQAHHTRRLTNSGIESKTLALFSIISLVLSIFLFQG